MSLDMAFVRYCCCLGNENVEFPTWGVQHRLIKYFSAELQKCNIGELKFVENSINCSDRFTNYKISQTAEVALGSKFKNPYKTSQSMPQHGSLGFSCTKYVMGETKIENKNNVLQIQTCISDTELLTYKIPIE